MSDHPSAEREAAPTGSSAGNDSELGDAAGTEPRRITVTGRVVRGHGVASGRSPSSPFPAGTIELQRPLFASLGLDLGHLHPATINVDIAPSRLTVERARHTFTDVRWTQVHGPETFSFLTCRLTRGEDPRVYAGWVYHPHPETKPMHVQPACVIELLMPFIDALRYGDPVAVQLDPREVTISAAPSDAYGPLT